MELLSLTVLTDSLVFMSNAVGSVFFHRSMMLRAVAMFVCLFFGGFNPLSFFSIHLFFIFKQQYQSTI